MKLESSKFSNINAQFSGMCLSVNENNTLIEPGLSYNIIMSTTLFCCSTSSPGILSSFFWDHQLHFQA